MRDDQDKCMALIDPLLRGVHDALHKAMEFYNNREHYST